MFWRNRRNKRSILCFNILKNQWATRKKNSLQDLERVHVTYLKCNAREELKLWKIMDINK